MPRLQRTRFLTCFYCGRKTSTQYTPRVRHFDCPNCEATNYLDENGEITDPPVATDKTATPAKFTVSRAVSPPLSPSGSTFCATCLKNQHLLSASLAQYLPDPDDPDYAERERGYYKFRKHQELLYPQICADCEPRVRERLEQAAYTAKTDVLRRMVDRSATARKVVKQSGGLDVFNALGGWTRTVSLVLQLLWHASILRGLLLNYFVHLNADPEFQTFKALRTYVSLLDSLPSPDWLIRWSFITTILSVWWNPHFVQVFRGFTKHLSGVSKWYTYQFMAVAVRAIVPKVSDISTPDPDLLSKQIAGHLFVVAFTVLLYILGPRSIRIDMTPLFATSPKSPAFRDAPLRPPSRQDTARPDEIKSMAQLLDEISRSPPRPASPPSPTAGEQFIPRPFVGHSQSMVVRRDDDNDLPLNSLHLSNSPPVQYDQEMDWSPTQSKHRAFNTFGQRQTQGFNQAPAEPLNGPFWYKVPPAPTTPAQRVFNPPNQPRLRQSPVDVRDNLFFRGSSGSGNPNRITINGNGGAQEDGGSLRRPVAFAEPSFFPPQAQNDPRNTLASMFGESLALREEQQTQQQQQQGKGSWLTRTLFGGETAVATTRKKST